MPHSKFRFRPWLGVAIIVPVIVMVIASRYLENHSKVDAPTTQSAEAAHKRAADSASAATQRSAAELDQAGERRGAVERGDSEVRSGARQELDRELYAALQITAPDARRRALRAIAEKLADAGDVVTAGDYVAALLGPDDRLGHGDAYTFTKVFAARLAARDVSAVMVWSEELPDVLKEVAYPFIARQSVAGDLHALSEWTRSIASPALRATVLRATSQELRRVGGDERSLEWARALAESPDGPRFSDLVVEHWARRDFSAATEWATKLSDVSDRETAFLSIATSAGEHVPAAALTWASSLPESDLRNRVVNQTLVAWANSDPAAAASWCEERPGDSAAVAPALPQIAAAWLRRDHEAASRWIARAPISRETKTYLLGISPALPATNQ